MKQNLRHLIRESIIQILEDETKFQEGDRVSTKDGQEGVISLSKHPFYAVKLDETGITTSFDFNDLKKIADNTEDNPYYGKYEVEPKDEIKESAINNIIHMDGILYIKDGLNLTDILSDIRSITGITVVRNIDIANQDKRTKLSIKIDPFPFSSEENSDIKSTVKTAIRRVPGVKGFWTREDLEKEKQQKETPTE